MVSKILQYVLTLLGLLVGWSAGSGLMPLLDAWRGQPLSPVFNMAVSGAVAALVGIIIFILSPRILKQIRRLYRRVENSLQRMATADIIVAALGLIIGLIIANLVGFSLAGLPLVGRYLPIVSNIFLGYLGLALAIRKRDELGAMLGLTRARAREAYKILDTSVIIDGRILDICRAGFIEGTLVVSTFVLQELRHIADSADALRRNRGRRGLDVLNSLQKDVGMKVQIYDKDFPDSSEVDAKLVALAQYLGGKILTNDYNLNKVCELQGVPVMNINELANALKPVVLPGEDMEVDVVREGKEPGQGIGYLTDGTMVVVENGRRFIGNSLPVTVTSVLQTAAGRMIFARSRS
jgi:uncharacterized protein YacL